jgi:chemotaxis protein MotB
MADPKFIFTRRRNSEEEHHGGAWKIAFADFMTAMMAFFLVLWIINAKDTPKKLLGRYFAVSIEEPARAPKGVHDTRSSPREPNDRETPGTPINGDPLSEKERKSGGATLGESSASNQEDMSQRGAPEASKPIARKPTMPEGELFRDPYRSLDNIASGDIPARWLQALIAGPPIRRVDLA